MALRFFARKICLLCGLWFAGANVVFSQTVYAPQGGEYPPAGTLAGDQWFPDLSIESTGGYLVWQDNATDGSGWGISARRIDSSLSGSLSAFQVNSQGASDQEKAKVMLLSGGGAAFVWQGGDSGAQQIYARFLSSSNTWLTGDVLVNTFTNGQHRDAAISRLADGNVVIVYSSYEQDGGLQGVYGQRLSPAGVKLGGEFQVNQTTVLNQRTPGVAGLSDGNFVVVWVNETQLSTSDYRISIYGRRFSAGGGALGGEFQINTGTNICANPSVTASPSGRFAVVWGQNDSTVPENSWDVFIRSLNNDGTGGFPQRLNAMLYGDQVGPKVAAQSSGFMAAWMSMGQDGSWEGVYGRFVAVNGVMSGNEFRINTTILSHQTQPVVASDGNNRYLALWTSYIGGANSYDLFAQRYVLDSDPLAPPSAPIVTALSSSSLSLTWPAVQGLNVVSYGVYADDAASPAVVTNNLFTVTNLAAGSTHHYKLDYLVPDGRRSPFSPTSTNRTYNAGTYGGIPYEWMAQYFGDDWPAATADSDGDGVSNQNEFLAGTDPTDATSVLRTRLQNTQQGVFLYWNTQPGLLYQVQASTSMGTWSNLGGPRFAAGYQDSLYVGGSGSGFYRIVRLR